MNKVLISLVCSPLLFLSLGWWSCESPQDHATQLWAEHQVEGVLPHLPYRVIELPIDNGVTIWNPSTLIEGPYEKIYGCNLNGEIFILLDSDGDGLEDEAKLFCDIKKEGLRTPTSLAHYEGAIYVGTATAIQVYRDLDNDLVADTTYTFFDDIPFSDHPYEYTSALTFNESGYLFCALTTDSWNAGASPDPRGYRGAILRISPDGRDVERWATGIRSVHGMDLSRSGDIFFVDNQGGQNANEELNLLRQGAFYGYDPKKYGNNLSTSEAELALYTEVAPSSIQFVTEAGIEYLYVAFYGPGEYWNRGGLAKIKLTNQSNEYETEEIPLMTKLPKISGLIVQKNGHIYVSEVGKTDYWYYGLEEPDGSIYRLIPDPNIATTPYHKDEVQLVSSSIIEIGERIFNERACNACHELDGKTELLGPNLKTIGQVYTREELLEEIEYPSRRIKPGMGATRVVTHDGTVYLGRMMEKDETKIKLMLIGNSIKEINAVDIKTSTPYDGSMMYEGLLTGLDEEEINALLDYLRSQSG